MYPFPKLRPKKLLVLTANTESVVRQWFSVLSSRSRFNESTMVFSKSIRDLVARQKTQSLIPDFVRHACETIQLHAITSPTLFTSPVSIQIIEKMRDRINRGQLPRSSDMADDFAIAQLLLSYFAEMPEPLLTNELYSEFYSYRTSQAAVKVGSQGTEAYSAEACAKLKAITAKLPIENAVTLRYLIKLLRLWEQESGEKKVVVPLLQQILMRPSEGQSASQMSMASDVAEAISYQLYTMLDELDLPSDAEAVETYIKPSITIEPKPIPVTVFSPEVKREILDSIMNNRPLNELDMSESRGGSGSVKRAIIIRNKGTEGSSGGRASSEGDGVSATSDTSEDSSSRHLFSFIHRKKKESSRAASSTTATSSSNAAAPGTPVVVQQPPGPVPAFAPAPTVLPPALSGPAPVPPTDLPDQAYLPDDLSYGPTTSLTTAPPVPPMSTVPPISVFPAFVMQPGTFPTLSVAPPTKAYEETEEFMDANEFMADFVPDGAPSHPAEPTTSFPLDNSALSPMPMSPVAPGDQFSTTSTAQR